MIYVLLNQVYVLVAVQIAWCGGEAGREISVTDDLHFINCHYYLLLDGE